jgi:hypothetical protein
MPALLVLGACAGDTPKSVDTAGLVDDAVDADGDGYAADEDCDDGDASVHPGAVEVCDGVDNNCADGVDEGVSGTWYTDADADGFGDAASPIEACDQPPGAVPSSSDCDDADPAVYPSAPEVCNGLDDNCDTQIDEGLASTWYPDLDDDGFGDADAGVETCAPEDGWVQVGRDCDDQEPAAFPGAVEICDGVDNDCDGDIDEDTGETFYADVDGDGYGDGAAPLVACSLPSGYAADAGDCDDGDFDVFPGAPEYCNGVDDDCDGTTDEDNARDASTWHLDADGDGYGLLGATTVACDAPSGYTAPTADFDCDDSAATTHPGADEYCDGHDDDCDGSIDEDDAVDAATWYEDADRDGYGSAWTTLTQCNQPTGYVSDDTDCDDLDNDVNPGEAEVCNDVDDDCNGSADDGLTTYDWYEDTDGDGFGDALSTQHDCDAPSGYVSDDTDCDDSDGDINPDADEVCDTVDNDCDGDIDDDDSDVTDMLDWFEDADGDGYGDPSMWTEACDEPSGYVADDTDCDDTTASVNPAASETCNGQDDDCDLSVDEGVLGTGAACAATDCAEILADNPSRGDGTYTLSAGSYHCDMTTDGGGWTRVGYAVPVWGTGYDTSYYNSEGFTWNEALFAYNSGSAHAHCTYPSAMTGCNPIGFQFASESWGVGLNWGSSICGMATTNYTSATTFVGTTDFIISRSSSTDTIRTGMLEGISYCTVGDNPGTAYLDILVRR